MQKKDILADITEKIEPFVSDYKKIRMLYGENEAEKAMATLNQAVQKLKYLLTLDEVKNVELKHDLPYFKKPVLGSKQGALVSVKPCADEYKGKTYVGFLIGEISIGCSLEIKGDTLYVNMNGMGNPAIFIPETGSTVMGYESWWTEIESIEDFKEITNEDIADQWYVKILKERLQKSEGSS